MNSIFIFLLLLAGFLYLASYFTVAIHELAHALVALGLGIPVYRLTLGRGVRVLATEHLVLRLFPFGGQIDLREDRPEGMVQITDGQISKIAIAGPLSNAAVSVLTARASLHFDAASLPWCILTFATLFNLLTLFQNVLAVEGTDGYLFWNHLSEKICGEPLSDWAITAVNKVGDGLLHVVLGLYMGWMIWTSGVLNPWFMH